MKTTKKLMSVILTLGLFLSQIQPVIAAQEYSLSNFTKTLSYADNSTFTDIGDSASSKPWYNGTIKNAYEYALIAGVGDAKFSPSGNLTTAQAITIAGRIHSIYKYGTLDNFNSYSGANWYDGPVQYAKAEGLISNEFDNVLTENITRADMVYIWYGILQSKDLTSQNIIESLPDVGSSNEKEVRIHRLYAAGILSGVDALGTFNPNTNITRAEAAAIFSRIVDVNQRKKDVRYPPEAGVEPTPQPSGVDPRVGTGNWRGNSFEMAARPNATGNPGGDAVPVDLSDYHIPTLSSNFNRWGIMKDSVVTELIASAFRTVRFEIEGGELYVSWSIPEMPEGYLMGFEIEGQVGKDGTAGGYLRSTGDIGTGLVRGHFPGQYRIKLEVNAPDRYSLDDIDGLFAAAEIMYKKENYGETGKFNQPLSPFESSLCSAAISAGAGRGSTSDNRIWGYGVNERLPEDCIDHWLDLMEPKPWEINPWGGTDFT